MKTIEKRIKNLEGCIKPGNDGVDWRNLSKEEEKTIIAAAHILHKVGKWGSMIDNDGMVQIEGTDEELRTLTEAVDIVTKRQKQGGANE